MSELFLRVEEKKTAVLDERLAGLTVAHGVLMVILVLAAIFRLGHLDAAPLAPEEAGVAWGAWQFWQPTAAPVAIPSPAYFSLTGLLSLVIGFSDATVRLVPALFSLGLVGLPWLLRGRLGTVGALVSSLLLAFSPVQAVAGRTASGTAVSLFAILLLVIAAVRYQETEDTTWLYTGGVALALGLTSSPLFYGGLTTVALAWLVQQKVLGPVLFAPKTPPVEPAVPPLDETETNDAAETPQPEPQTDVSTPSSLLDNPTYRITAVIVAVLTILLSTFFLFNLNGIGDTAALPAAWLGQFGLSAMESPLSPFLAIGRYEVVLLVFGIIAIFWAAFQDEPSANFCVYWLVAILILVLLQQGEMQNVALALVPGYLLLGVFANTIIGKLITSTAWGLASGLFILGMVSLLHLARLLRTFNTVPPDLTHLWIIFLAVAFGLTSIYLAANLDWRAALQGTVIAVGLLCLYYQWGTGWWLTQWAANDPRERWVTVATTTDLPVMAHLLEEISQQLTGSDKELDVISAVNSPVLRWYLRDFRNIQFVETLPAVVQNAAVISPFNTELLLDSDYVGSDFGLVWYETPITPETPRSSWIDVLRWWLFHETTAVSATEKVILWVRADLVRNQ